MTDRMQYAKDAGARAHRAVGELDLLADKRARNVEYVCKANCANPVLVFQHPEKQIFSLSYEVNGQSQFYEDKFQFLVVKFFFGTETSTSTSTKMEKTEKIETDRWRIVGKVS